MASFLFNIVVAPIVYIVQLSFSVFFRLLGNAGLSIIGVSLVINALCLPLYRMADAQQDREREQQRKMEYWVNHIKATFKGDERYMMLSTYYDQQHYNQLSVLNGSLSLLLQIPIFMAAYSFLSNLDLLEHSSFFWLSSLGEPDRLLQIGGMSINVLPILMTLFNVVSTFIYTRGLKFKDKIQAYGLAIVFLVLLYQSPSGLVMYWTCNQIFSLIKNILLKVLKHPRRVLGVLAQILVVGSYLVLSRRGLLLSTKRKLFILMIYALLELVVFAPALAALFRGSESKGKHKAKARAAKEAMPSSLPTFLLAAFVLTAVLGLLIPTALVSDSPNEFMNINDFVNPLYYIANVACIIGGLFVLWVGTYYYLSDTKGKRAFACALWVLVGVVIVDYMFFGRNLGTITTDLTFENNPSFTRHDMLVNLAVLAALVFVLLVVWKFQHGLVNPILGILLATTVGMSIPNAMAIQKSADVVGAQAEELARQNSEGQRTYIDEDGNILPLFKLSRKGNNVVVLFLDRSINEFVPYLLNERPELARQFDGFTWYPNTISFACHTVLGAPAMYGGYEYTPQAMNERSDESLIDKHNESLKVLGTVFGDEGYDVTLIDPPLVDHVFYNADFSSLSDMPNTNLYTTIGTYVDKYSSSYKAVSKDILQRNFVYYSIFKGAPVFLQTTLYDEGSYWDTRTIDTRFINFYSTLTFMDDLTEITDGDEETFMYLCNDTTHMPTMLQLPEYEPAFTVNNDGLEDYTRTDAEGHTIKLWTTYNYRVMHYHVNMAAYLQLGKWFDYLREQGVYDNTRIIIVADHGNGLNLNKRLKTKDGFDTEWVNPLLMMKDFNATGFNTSYDFMTNADVPTMALKGLVDNPVNPYTGVALNDDAKANGKKQIVSSSMRRSPYMHEKNTFDLDDGNLYTVSGDIFDANNWELIDKQGVPVTK